jgi:hypothetical protein
MSRTRGHPPTFAFAGLAPGYQQRTVLTLARRWYDAAKIDLKKQAWDKRHMRCDKRFITPISCVPIDTYALHPKRRSCESRIVRH